MDMTTRQRSHQFYIASIPSIPFNTNPPANSKTWNLQNLPEPRTFFQIQYLWDIFGYSSWECDPIPDSTAFMMSIASTWRVVTAHVQSQCSLCFCHCLLEGAFFCSPWCLRVKQALGGTCPLPLSSSLTSEPATNSYVMSELGVIYTESMRSTRLRFWLYLRVSRMWSLRNWSLGVEGYLAHLCAFITIDNERCTNTNDAQDSKETRIHTSYLQDTTPNAARLSRFLAELQAGGLSSKDAIRPRKMYKHSLTIYCIHCIHNSIQDKRECNSVTEHKASGLEMLAHQHQPCRIQPPFRGSSA
jgi:hypothetical protein